MVVLNKFKVILNESNEVKINEKFRVRKLC